MSPTSAAKDLYDELHRYGWLVSVGVGAIDHTGQPVLLVYATNIAQARSKIPSSWRGFQVTLKRMGKVRPARRSIG
jgi:hypothetical protein